MFTVKIPFGPFETGESITADSIREKVPGADIPRLVRLESLVPLPGFKVGTLTDPVASQEQAEDVIAELHAKVVAGTAKAEELTGKLVEAKADTLKAIAVADNLERALVDAKKETQAVLNESEGLVRKLSTSRTHIAVVAKGNMNLEVLKPIKGHRAGDVISPKDVAEDLAGLLDDGSVGWTDKSLPTPTAPEQKPAEVRPADESPAAPANDPQPAAKKKAGK